MIPALSAPTSELAMHSTAASPLKFRRPDQCYFCFGGPVRRAEVCGKLKPPPRRPRPRTHATLPRGVRRRHRSCASPGEIGLHPRVVMSHNCAGTRCTWRPSSWMLSLLRASTMSAPIAKKMQTWMSTSRCKPWASLGGFRSVGGLRRPWELSQVTSDILTCCLVRVLARGPGQDRELRFRGFLSHATLRDGDASLRCFL